MLSFLIAGIAYITPTTSAIALDAPPPGYTTLAIRYNELAAGFAWGAENDAAQRATGTSWVQGSLGLYNGNVEVLSDRLFSPAVPFNFTAFDGLVDFAGTSGHLVQANSSKSPFAWNYYAGTPAALSVVKRQAFFQQGMYVFSHQSSWAPTAIVEWEWLP